MTYLVYKKQVYTICRGNTNEYSGDRVFWFWELWKNFQIKSERRAKGTLML